MSKSIALLQGGLSSEREVSKSTGASMAKALDELGYKYSIIDVDSDLPKVLMDLRPDIALLALHGKYAEDGTVQGICEYLKIPYTGSGMLASALANDKLKSKEIVSFYDIPTANFEVLFTKLQDVNTYKAKMPFPLVVKPCREGSSVGVTICKEESQFRDALLLAAKHDSKILIEEFIKGPEVTVSVVDGKAYMPIEIRPKVDFYNYENKYTKGNTEYLLPPELKEEVIQNLKKYAEKIYQIIDARAYARIDFMVRNGEEPMFMEMNTLPGCTETSLLPKAVKYEGLSFADLIKLLIDKAGLDYEGLV